MEYHICIKLVCLVRLEYFLIRPRGSQTLDWLGWLEWMFRHMWGRSTVDEA